MTRKISISVPDDVAEYLETKPNVSAAVVSAVVVQMRLKKLDELHARLGIVVTPEGQARARARLDRVAAARAARNAS